MTDDPLGPIKLALKDGDEPFTQAGESKGFDLLEFWRWSTSDLVDNATRGVLAESIVAKALKIETLRPRQSWAPWDLTWNAPGAATIKLEGKSAAYLQSWGFDQLQDAVMAAVCGGRPSADEGPQAEATLP